MANKIQPRRDTAANWTAANPVLAIGELGYETDTRKYKRGNGATAWTGLGYHVSELAQLNSTFVRFLDTDGNPISGSLVTIVVDTVLGEIDDIIVEAI